MPKPAAPWLQSPCEENGWKWRVYGCGMVWDHGQEWQARWKLHYLQVSQGTLTDNGDRHSAGVSERDRPLPTPDENAGSDAGDASSSLDKHTG